MERPPPPRHRFCVGHGGEQLLTNLLCKSNFLTLKDRNCSGLTRLAWLRSQNCFDNFWFMKLVWLKDKLFLVKEISVLKNTTLLLVYETSVIKKTKLFWVNETSMMNKTRHEATDLSGQLLHGHGGLDLWPWCPLSARLSLAAKTSSVSHAGWSAAFGSQPLIQSQPVTLPSMKLG